MSDSSVGSAPAAAPVAPNSPALVVTFDDLMKFVEAVGGKAAPVEHHVVADAKAELAKVRAAFLADLKKLVPSGHTVTAVAAFTALGLHFPAFFSMVFKALL